MHEEVIQPLPVSAVGMRDETPIDGMAHVITDLRGVPSWVRATVETEATEDVGRVVLPVGDVDHPGWEFRAGDTVLRAAAIRDGWVVASVVTPGHDPIVMAFPAAT